MTVLESTEPIMSCPACGAKVCYRDGCLEDCLSWSRPTYEETMRALVPELRVRRKNLYQGQTGEAWQAMKAAHEARTTTLIDHYANMFPEARRKCEVCRQWKHPTMFRYNNDSPVGRSRCCNTCKKDGSLSAFYEAQADRYNKKENRVDHKATQEPANLPRHELRERIEARFYRRADGASMTWNNYGRGGWQYDHVIPQAQATTENYHLVHSNTNYQPLWEEDNSSKGARLDWVHPADRDPSRWQNPFFDSLYGSVRPGVRFSY